MLEDIFVTILRMSFYGSIGGAVILVCVLTDYVRVPKWISMSLWGLLALRLVLPVSLSSDASFFRFRNLSDQIENVLDFEGTYGGDYKVAIEGSSRYERAVASGSPVKTQPNGTRMAYYYEGNDGLIEPAKPLSETILPIASRIWLGGVAALWLWAIFSYIHLKSKLRFAMKLSEGVYETDAISSPCVVGIFRPRIYLTMGLTDRQREHILLHERMHLRYLDHIWKILSFAVISLHWFNLFLWPLYRLFQGDLEKACDERVLRRLGETEREDYSESLLALSAERNRQLPTPICFGENDVKERVKRILAYRKPLLAVSVPVAILAVLMCVVFLTLPKTAREDLDEPTDQAAISQPADELEDPPVTTPPESIAPSKADASESNSSEELKILEELSDNGILYQARLDGIYRVLEDGTEERIYEGYPGRPKMQIFEDKMYFMTDSFYTEGALDWEDNAIRMLDLETLEWEDLSLVRRDALISTFVMREGVITIWYAYPDVTDSMMLYREEDTLLNGRNILELTAAEAETLSWGISASAILQNRDRMYNVSHRTKDANLTFLDMDGDGRLEKITLESLPDSQEPLTDYRLQIGEARLDGHAYTLANTLWALSLDGEHVLLALHDDGPSDDPETILYAYRDGEIHEIGRFEDKPARCTVSPDGIITGGKAVSVIQDDWIEVSWRLGADGLLEEIPQDIYDFISLNSVELYVDLPLHPEIGSEETFTVTPQQVKFLQTTADGEWVLVETADGESAWVHIVDHEVAELKEDVLDVFAARLFAGW